jgi:hypothetical protein
MPRIQAKAIQMLVPPGCCVNRSRMVLTMDVTGWWELVVSPSESPRIVDRVQNRIV